MLIFKKLLKNLSNLNAPPKCNDFFNEEGYNISTYQKYYKILEQIHNFYKPKFYIEIGVRDGDSLRLCQSDCLAVGVDSGSLPSNINNPNIKIFQQTSDNFFKSHDVSNEFGKVDIGFIDGMHLFEFFLRDFINIEKHSKKDSIIIIHDTNPIDEISSSRERKTNFWTGDVYKIPMILKEYRPDLKIINLDVALTGLCFITNLDNKSTILNSNYDKIFKSFVNLNYSDIANDKVKKLNIKKISKEFDVTELFSD